MRRYMNIKLKTLIMGCLVASSLQVGAFAQEAVSYPGYRLAWAEEFEGAGLPDSNYWNTGDTGGVINNEWQDYRKENLNCTRLEDGKLILTAYKDPHKGVRGWGSKEDYHFKFSSGEVHSCGKKTFKYGRIDVSAKIPTGRGVWPAIWLLPDKSPYGGWPNGGEIDIMEYVWGDDEKHSTTYSTVHTFDSDRNGNKIGSGYGHSSTLDTDFHLYSLVWEEERLDILFDDQVIFSYHKKEDSYKTWPFDQPFYLIMNIAVGGTWGDDWGVDESIFPKTMEIDYVRYYEKEPCEVINPVIDIRYSADPSARVFNDTLYIYPSHDRDEARWWDMEDYYVYSTTDMCHYKDEGLVFEPLKQTSWAKKYAWAPDCVEKNGKYYFYFPTDQDYIGVAVGDSPVGPFKDVIGKPLVTRHSPGIKAPRDFIDPAVFIDDDGTAYLLVGQNALNIIRLNEDMMSYEGKPVVLDNVNQLPYFFEGIWMHKYKGKYYLSYSTGPNIPGRGPQIAYAVADSVYGPYQYKGVILEEVSSGTNHSSIVEYKGQWYLFYHTSERALSLIPEGSPERDFIQWRRSVCVAPLYYNEDGTIRPVDAEKSFKIVCGK